MLFFDPINIFITLEKLPFSNQKVLIFFSSPEKHNYVERDSLETPEYELGTHNICSCGEITKLYFSISLISTAAICAAKSENAASEDLDQPAHSRSLI